MNIQEDKDAVNFIINLNYAIENGQLNEGKGNGIEQRAAMLGDHAMQKH